MREHVNSYWRGNSFDLALPYDSAYGNCDLCFLKGKRSLARLIRAEPERVEWWQRMEESIHKSDPNSVHYKESSYQFNQEYRYQDLIPLAQQGDLFDIPDDQQFDCFCG